MPDAWGWFYPGDNTLTGAVTNVESLDGIVEQHNVLRVPLVVESAKVKHADDLYQVLKDLTGLAKLASSPLNAYQAAIRNADELLKQIERESTEDVSHG